MASLYLHLFNLFSTLLPGSASAIKRAFLVFGGGRCARQVHFSHGVFVYGNSFTIGMNVWFSEGCMLYSGFSKNEELIKIGDNCDFGPRVLLCCGSHEVGDAGRRAGRGYLGPIRIGEGCWIGAGAIVLGGVVLGRGCVIAAGAVVKPGIYPDGVLLAEVPAVIKKAY